MNIRRAVIAATLAAMAAVAAPAAATFAVAAPAAASNCPSTGLKRAPAVLVTASGRHSYSLEVAATADAQQCGLMYRKTMKRSSGMIFVFAPPRPASFWMENTVLPLDLVFVGSDDRVLTVASGKPFSRDIIDSRGVAAAVIELNAGEAKRIGLKPGDRVER